MYPTQKIAQERQSHVVSEAIDCGWVWNIPVQTRIGSGLVFNRTIQIPRCKEKIL